MRITMTLLMAALLWSAGCSKQGAQTTSAASVTSADLRQLVQSKLASDPQLAQVSVNADAELNQVTLSGPVPSEQARSEAVDMTKVARPSLTVVDKLEVKPQVAARSDYTEDMARDAEQKAKALGDKVGRSLDDAWIYTKIEAQLARWAATQTINVPIQFGSSG